MDGMKKMYSKTAVFFCLLLCAIFLAGWSLSVRAAGTEVTRGEETEALAERILKNAQTLFPKLGKEADIKEAGISET